MNDLNEFRVELEDDSEVSSAESDTQIIQKQLLYNSVLFSDDVMVPILTYADVHSVSQLSLTSKVLHSMLLKHPVMEAVWMKHSELLWTDKSFNRPAFASLAAGESHPLDLLHRVTKIPLADLKKRLANVDLSRCIEKRDYQRMLMAHLVFGPAFLKFVKVGEQRVQGRRFYPAWTLNMNPFRMSYVFNRTDAKRQAINESELCDSEWYFVFKDRTSMLHHDQQWEMKFLRNMTVISALHNNVMPWQFVLSTDDSSMVQISEYPPLTSSRLPSGQWKLENPYVNIFQSSSLDGANLPLY